MSFDNLRILIADDHPLFRFGLHQAIQAEAGVILHEAADGHAALAIIREQHPDIAILDINMPHLDGVKIVRQIRAEHLPGEIIFLTMYKEEEIFNAAMDLGVKGYVLKDGAVSEIIDCVRSVAAGHRYVSPLLSDYLFARRNAAEKLHTDRPGLDRLTPAERRILKLIAEDNTSKEIAEQLGLSPRTVENHRTNICDKLGVHGIHGLVKFAYDNRSHL